MDHTANRITSPKGNTAGETLVETLVAFAVLMVLLTLVTTAVKVAASLNSHAVLQMNELEDAGLAAETGGGGEQGEAKLTVAFSSESGIQFVGPNGEGKMAAELPVTVMRAGEDVPLLYFTEGSGSR